MTSLVHGATAASDASAAADILFGADPVRASREAFDVVSHEVETVSVTTDDLLDTVAVLVRSGLAVSNSDARRSLQQKALKANGSVLDDENPLSNTALSARPIHPFAQGQNHVSVARSRALNLLQILVGQGL